MTEKPHSDKKLEEKIEIKVIAATNQRQNTIETRERKHRKKTGPNEEEKQSKDGKGAEREKRKNRKKNSRGMQPTPA